MASTTKENKPVITAKASHVLVSPRKANLLLKAIVGKPAVEVTKTLPQVYKRAADPVLKLVKQAIGNAVSQHQLSPDALVVESAYATKGRVLKRFRIGGRGRTKPYEKTASHLTLNLGVKKVSLPQPKAAKSVEKTTKAVSKPAIAKTSTKAKTTKSKSTKNTKK